MSTESSAEQAIEYSRSRLREPVVIDPVDPHDLLDLEEGTTWAERGFTVVEYTP